MESRLVKKECFINFAPSPDPLIKRGRLSRFTRFLIDGFCEAALDLKGLSTAKRSYTRYRRLGDKAALAEGDYNGDCWATIDPDSRR
jgi:hypothetical protein